MCILRKIQSMYDKYKLKQTFFNKNCKTSPHFKINRAYICGVLNSKYKLHYMAKLNTQNILYLWRERALITDNRSACPCQVVSAVLSNEIRKLKNLLIKKKSAWVILKFWVWAITSTVLCTFEKRSQRQTPQQVKSCHFEIYIIHCKQSIPQVNNAGWLASLSSSELNVRSWWICQFC